MSNITEHKLVPLVDFNEKRTLAHSIATDNSPRPNGIACPECGCELMDTSPHTVLMSNPPKKNTNCCQCDYKGYRIS